MYVAEVISCSDIDFWYNDYTDQFFELSDNYLYNFDLSKSDYTIDKFSLKKLITTNNNIKVKNIHCIEEALTFFILLKDVKIHNKRKLKLNKIRNVV